MLESFSGLVTLVDEISLDQDGSSSLLQAQEFKLPVTGSAMRRLRLDTAADDLIATRVRRSLQGTGRQMLAGLHVACEAGAVTLTGSVSSYYMKQLAQYVAMNTEGVERIDSRIEVG